LQYPNVFFFLQEQENLMNEKFDDIQPKKLKNEKKKNKMENKTLNYKLLETYIELTFLSLNCFLKCLKNHRSCERRAANG